ncbi:hypothetical protein [Pseudogemmobacter humi]|uniref:hypothetical protein n=1 Tax=Pseudogemmobacter humi TaxID=2483812 RepID=UPI000F53541B|nr:hypothetical protein [Pseudogemmobacter humi]
MKAAMRVKAADASGVPLASAGRRDEADLIAIAAQHIDDTGEPLALFGGIRRRQSEERAAGAPRRFGLAHIPPRAERQKLEIVRAAMRNPKMLLDGPQCRGGSPVQHRYHGLPALPQRHGQSPALRPDFELAGEHPSRIRTPVPWSRSYLRVHETGSSSGEPQWGAVRLAVRHE